MPVPVGFSTASLDAGSAQSIIRAKFYMPKYILNIPSLQPGDIVLTREKTLTSIGIQTLTACRYSHAAIYVGKTTIEATLEGVFSKNPQRLLFDKVDDVAIFRSKNKLTESEISAICSYARSKTGSLYALDEAITIRVRSTLKLDSSSRQFCSRLVAESYRFAGVDLKNLRNPTYCTPRQLSLCKAFYKVDGVVREASAAEVNFANSYDPTYENQKQTYQWLNKVRALVKSKENLKHIDIQTINDVDDFLISHPEFDEEIAQFMKDSGYLDFYNHDTKQNPYRYNEQLFLITMQSQPDYYQFLEQELDKEPDMLNVFANVLDAHIRHVNSINLECFRLHLQLYINLITGIYARLEIIKKAAKYINDIEFFGDIQKLQDMVGYIITTGQKCLKSKTAEACI
jgi:hypothetical protein